MHLHELIIVTAGEAHLGTTKHSFEGKIDTRVSVYCKQSWIDPPSHANRESCPVGQHDQELCHCLVGHRQNCSEGTNERLASCVSPINTDHHAEHPVDPAIELDVRRDTLVQGRMVLSMLPCKPAALRRSHVPCIDDAADRAVSGFTRMEWKVEKAKQNK